MNKSLKNNIFLITYAAILIAIFMNINGIMSFINRVIIVLNPFIYGLAFAYVINWPYSFLVNRLSRFKLKYNKVISLVLAYTFVVGVIVFLIRIIIPQVIYSMVSIINMGTEYYPAFENWLNGVPFSEQIKQVFNNFISRWDAHLENTFTSVFNFTKDFTVSFYNWIIGFVISIYLLSSKEKLFKLVKRLVIVYLPKRINSVLFEVFSVICDVFGLFLKGKTLDSIIVGILCFIGMTIFRMPYAVLISVVVGLTNIIPFFGPFIGAIPSIIIMLVVDPIKAVWFAVFIFVLQQIDGNLIGPKILGNSMGISGIFIIFSVLLGGGLFGVPGMILGVPLFAAVYIILGRVTRKKENLLED